MSGIVVLSLTPSVLFFALALAIAACHEGQVNIRVAFVPTGIFGTIIGIVGVYCAIIGNREEDQAKKRTKQR
jgi:hypothetical protein